MRVCSYLEVRGLVDQSGIGVAQRNTLRVLARAGIDVTDDPRERYDLLHLQIHRSTSVDLRRAGAAKGNPSCPHSACVTGAHPRLVHLRYHRCPGIRGVSPTVRPPGGSAARSLAPRRRDDPADFGWTTCAGRVRRG